MKAKIIGFGCDAASANVAERSFKVILKIEVPWIFMFWCLAHCLELSVKDSLHTTLFSTIDDILLHIYYNKSPKNAVN